MKVTTPAKSNFLNRTPLWTYPAALVVIILLLSLTPGGSDIKVLIIPVLGWASTIYFFRKYKWVRTFVYVCLVIIAMLATCILVLANGMEKMLTQ